MAVMLNLRDRMIFASGFFQGATSNYMMLREMGMPADPALQKANAEICKAMFRKLKLSKSQSEKVIQSAIADSQRSAAEAKEQGQ